MLESFYLAVSFEELTIMTVKLELKLEINVSKHGRCDGISVHLHREIEGVFLLYILSTHFSVSACCVLSAAVQLNWHSIN